ncbi:uncharacterized protein LDX57_004881 [Aspergillus melleus]|uniref:uncharacterized protein n=1 Tax=Aspergillus melleus TaxID=138277 RepID=UPI001E8CF76C|nr:uncharacterized protein LDX57_004881 [Aspergillus melleus]KAH8427166.1 hypothetical protein LDX57_004881 [Aspergillus melleus]
MAARTVAAVAMLAAVCQAMTITPHLDPQCKNATSFTWGFSEDSRWTDEAVEPKGISEKLSNVAWYGNVEFPEEAAGEGSGAYDVWWRVQDLDPGCRFALINLYTQKNYGMVPGVEMPGNQILNVGAPGCFYSSLPALQDIGATFCCGQGDCGSMNLGNSALTKREEEQVQPPTEKRDARRKHAKGEQRAALKAALERREDEDWDGSGCKAVDTWGPSIEAGKQTIIGSTQYCGSNDACSFPISGSISSGTTLSSSSSQTITNGMDVSVGVSVGSDFIVKSEVSTTMGYNFAESIATENGVSVDESKTFTVGNTLTQKPGTRAFLTFTPTYKCFEASLDCGGPTSEPLWLCNPETTGEDSIQGDYMVVYTN